MSHRLLRASRAMWYSAFRDVLPWVKALDADDHSVYQLGLWMHPFNLRQDAVNFGSSFERYD